MCERWCMRMETRPPDPLRTLKGPGPETHDRDKLNGDHDALAEPSGN